MLGKLCRLDKRCGPPRNVTLESPRVHCNALRQFRTLMNCISEAGTTCRRLIINDIRRVMLRVRNTHPGGGMRLRRNRWNNRAERSRGQFGGFHYVATAARVRAARCRCS
jgi:hypothetical protein